MKNSSFHKQIPKNLAINIFSFLSTAIIGVWLTPYLLKNLGIVAFGLIPLAMFFSQYVGVIVNSINMSINRFLVIRLQKNEDIEANEIFNTSLVIISLFTLVQALIMSIVLFDITFFFEIPGNLVIDAIWLFGLTFIGFSISLLRSVFGASLYAYNRLDILRITDVFQNVVRVVTIVVIFSYDEPSLKYIGIGNLLAALSAVIPTIYYFKRYTPQLIIKISLFRKKRVSELSRMSIWILINQVGVLLLGNIDLYFVNRLIGSQGTGEYAIIIQLTSIFRTVTGLLGGVLGPVIMIYYANNEHEKLKKALVVASKLMAIFMIVPLAVVVFYSGSIISIWLGNEYYYMKDILSFSLLFLIFTIPIMPLYNVNITFDKVRLPAILVIVNGLINMLSIYLLLTYTDLGLWGVVLTKLILEIGYTAIFMPIYVANILKTRRLYFFQIPLISMLVFSITYSIIYLMPYFRSDAALFEVISLIVFSICVLIAVFLILLLNKQEKILLLSGLATKRNVDEC